MKIITHASVAFFSLYALVTADPITTFRFAGTVQSVGADLGPAVSVGDFYEADFVFDEATALFNNFGNLALYNNLLSEIRIQTTGGTLTWSASDPLGNDINNGFTIDNNNLGRDAITFSTGPGQLLGPALNGEAVVGHNFNLSDFTQTAFSSTAIPNSLSPSSFALKVLTLTFDGNLEADTIRFNLSSITKNPAPVPEPSTYLTLAGGTLALLMLRSRRAR